MHSVFFFHRRIQDANFPLKTRFPKFSLQGLTSNKDAVAQGKLLLNVI
jgi:hypothetical protein